MKKRVVAIIPARLASSRFPGKPLARILGLPMIEHVRRRAQLAKGIDEVFVATGDQAIIDPVTDAGGKAVMPPDTHERASERAAEAMRTLKADVVAVVQGDEPALWPDAVAQVVQPLLEHKDLVCISLLSPLESDADCANPDIVKAACDQCGHVIFFSRASIPYYQRKVETCPVYRETGIRAFRADFLQAYSVPPQTPFELAEPVSMLGVLEHGYRILGVLTSHATLGVDHPEDILLVERLIRTDPAQRRLYEKILGRKIGVSW